MSHFHTASVRRTCNGLKSENEPWSLFLSAGLRQPNWAFGKRILQTMSSNFKDQGLRICPQGQPRTKYQSHGQHHCLYQTVLLPIRTELPSRVAGAEVNVSVSNAHQFRRQRASKVRVSPPCQVPPQRSASNPYHSSRRIRIVSTEGTIETREASHYRSGVIERQARVSNAHQFRRQRARSVTERACRHRVHCVLDLEID